MKCSFVITYCARRRACLEQCLRFLGMREPRLLDQEVIIVCQDHDRPPPSPFARSLFIPMQLGSYNRPKMVNAGVRAACGDVLVLLDGDRILPVAYFHKQVWAVGVREVITTQYMLRLLSPLADEDILAGLAPAMPDDRSLTNEPHRKNLFSGNVVMRRADYLACGGMDEGYVGYGFNDNDMTRTVLAAGYRPIYVPEVEIHLHHDRDFSVDGASSTAIRLMCAINHNRYCRKWGDPPPHLLNDEVVSDVSPSNPFLPRFLREVKPVRFHL